MSGVSYDSGLRPRNEDVKRLQAGLGERGVARAVRGPQRPPERHGRCGRRNACRCRVEGRVRAHRERGPRQKRTPEARQGSICEDPRCFSHRPEWPLAVPAHVARAAHRRRQCLGRGLTLMSPIPSLRCAWHLCGTGWLQTRKWHCTRPVVMCTASAPAAQQPTASSARARSVARRLTRETHVDSATTPNPEGP